jgi:hypothetical protein
MLANELLLAQIRLRKVKNATFNSGILIADRYAKTIQECVGSDICYRFASKGNISYQDVIKRASNTLTYNNPEMVIEDIYTKSKQILDASGEAIELPKHTMMVFRHTLTTPRKDRDGDIMRTQGAKPDPKMLLLWNHVHTLPIGKLIVVAEHNSKKLSVISCIVDMNELCHDSAVMIEAKMGRFSHGFKALEFSKIKEHREEEGGFDVKSFEIMEESLVSVPSNVDAEVDDILLSLAEGGKFKSAMMLNVGKSIRAKKPLVIVVEKDMKKLGLEKSDSEEEEEHDETKGKGKEGCTCEHGASKETDDEVDEEKDADDKEMKLCPKCGETMKNGSCKCGYSMKDAEEDETMEEEEEKSKKKPFQKPEDEEKPSEEAEESDEDEEEDEEDKSKQMTCKKCGGSMKDGSCEKCGYSMLKKDDDGDEEKSFFDSSKVGRTVSLKNMTNLQHAKKCVEEVHNKEMLMTLGGKALCKDAVKSITEVLDTVPKEPLGGETSVDDIDAKQAMAIFIAKSTDDLRRKMRHHLDTLEELAQTEKRTSRFLKLKGGPGSGPRPGGGGGGNGNPKAHAHKLTLDAYRASGATTFGPVSDAVSRAARASKAGKHREASQAHREAAGEHGKESKRETPFADYHRVAEQAHTRAAEFHETLA